MMMHLLDLFLMDAFWGSIYTGERRGGLRCGCRVKFRFESVSIVRFKEYLDSRVNAAPLQCRYNKVELVSI